MTGGRLRLSHAGKRAARSGGNVAAVVLEQPPDAQSPPKEHPPASWPTMGNNEEVEDTSRTGTEEQASGTAART
ncbi:MAG: hypothetical protein QM811_24350 [Pirellulales bacterium]